MFPIRDHNPSNKTPLVTVFLILVNSYVFFKEISSFNPDTVINQFGLISANVDFGNIYTLVPFATSIFLHGGWLHIISNMWFLWIFGDNVEADLGHIKFFLFYLISGIMAGFFQYMTNPGSTIPMIGASGAIAGVLGAYMVLYPRHKIDTLVPISFFLTRVQIPALIMIFYWFIVQLFSGIGSLSLSLQGGIAFWAHIGGFLTGFTLINLIRK